MRRWLLGASLVVVAHAYGQTEKINAWHTDLTVAPDGQLTVTEEITIHAEGDEFKRGIVRRLPLLFEDHNGKEHHVEYHLSTVEVSGTTSPYHTATEGEDFVLYVGQKNVFLKPGDYRYRITYTTEGQVGSFPDYDEIYWNVNGNGWNFPIDKISAEIHLPPMAQVKQTACYTGEYGSKENACTMAMIDTHTVRFQGRALRNYEGLTVAVGFQKGVVAAAYDRTEKINSFHTDLTVAPNGRLMVTEEINAHVEGIEFKRGIVRKLPLLFQDHNGRENHVRYDIINVQMDGAPAPHHTATEGNEFVLYVGEKNTLIKSGDHRYRINYSTKGQVGFFPEYDEIYWNVNGNGWAFTVDSISAVIHLPPTAQVKQTACYTGSYGSTETACTDSIIDAHTVSFRGRAMDSYEGLTVAVGFQKGVVAEPPPPPFFERYAVPLLGVCITLLLLLYYFVTWFRFGRDPDMPTVIPLFEPPDDLSPASVGMVMDGGFDNALITPAMIGLAVKGHIRIDEKKEDMLLGLISKETYSIVKLKEGSGLPVEEQKLLNCMFDSGQDRFEIDGTYDPGVQSMASAFQTTLKSQWSAFLNKGNNLRFWWIPILSVIVCGISMIVLHTSYWGDHDAVYIIAFAVANLILFVFYVYVIKRPSEEKQALRARLFGFKMYLGAAEEKQIQHFNPPTMTPEVFEKYLPYAIAFKVEKIWGDRFQSMISRALVDSSYHPGWYSGSILNYGSFSSHMNSSLSSSVRSSSTPPSKSSGGSGGGGFSGGGGGGGGGGGW